MDIFEKCFNYIDAREAIKQGVYPYFIALTENEGSEVMFHDQRLIMCGSNNYLGLTTHPKVREAAVEAIKRYGTSCTGSRFLNGTLEMHHQLEQELAEYLGKQAALCFSTGMQVNLGTVSSLVRRGDRVILDKEDHASIVDGAFLSGGKIERFNHNDMEHLERVMASLPEEAGKLIIVDGVFSMGGDLSPLDKLVPIAQKYHARIMIDDAHGIGVTGGGRGTAEQFGLTDQVDLIMSTFSKSFASLGGFIAGNEDVIHYIKHHAPLADLQRQHAACQYGRRPWLRCASCAMSLEWCQRVNQHGEKIRHGLRSMGFNIGEIGYPRSCLSSSVMIKKLLRHGRCSLKMGFLSTR